MCTLNARKVSHFSRHPMAHPPHSPFLSSDCLAKISSYPPSFLYMRSQAAKQLGLEAKKLNWATAERDDVWDGVRAKCC